MRRRRCIVHLFPHRAGFPRVFAVSTPKHAGETGRGVTRALEESAEIKRAFAAGVAPAAARAVAILVECFRGGGKVLLFGNGGSASDAQHIAAEWTGRFRRERPGLPAIALSANTSDVTAIGNDYGYDRVFARLVEAHGRDGDVAIAISTSGNSTNVLAAVAEARARGLATLGLSGMGGGKLAACVDVPFVVPSERTDRIQESHITLLHALCDAVDEALFGDAA
jgi:D-sedoheptulose 7-phosphate isomerase